MREVLSHGVVEVVKVASLVLVMRRVVPNLRDGLANLFGKHFDVGEVLENNQTLLLRYLSLGKLTVYAQAVLELVKSRVKGKR